MSWRDGGWQVSFLVEDGIVEVTPLGADPRTQVGIDRGVKVAVALSDGRMIDQAFTGDIEQQHLTRLQRRLSRQHGPRSKPPKAEQRANPNARGRRQAPSRRYLRTRARIAAAQTRQRRRRDDFLAKTANVLAGQHSLIAVENLNTAGMTRRPKPKPKPGGVGGFAVNNGASKAGVNRAILGKGWGKFALQLAHQARYTGARIMLVPAAFTSQRCHQCGHIEAGNRENQADFRCCACGHTANADTNAALNILRLALTAAIPETAGTTTLGYAAGHDRERTRKPGSGNTVGSVNHQAASAARNPRP